MNIYKYALKSFKHNAGKGIISMTALSIILICAVLNIAWSLQNTFYKNAVSIAGDAHVKYKYITSAQVEYLSNHESVEWADMQLSLNAWGCAPGDDNAINISYSSCMGKMTGFTLDSGHAPNSINEAAMPPHTAALFGLKGQAGERFTLIIHYLDGSEESFEFIISGIIEQQKTLSIMEINYIYVSEQFIYEYGNFGEVYGRDENFKQGNDLRELFLHFKKGYIPQSIAFQLAESTGIDKQGVSLNDQYLNADLKNPSMIITVILALTILLLVGALVIYNAFNIIIIQRTHQFGMLTLIGASKKQIKLCVYLEAMLTTITALPIGLLLGTCFSYFGMPLVEKILTDVELVHYTTLWSYVLTTILAVIMVFIGVSRPARKAAKATPVEAVRFSGVSEKTYKRKEESNITLPVLAKLNIKRSRARTLGTIISLSISGVLFLAICTIGFSLVDSMGYLTKHMIAGDIQIKAGVKMGSTYYYYPDTNPLNDDTIKAITNIDGIINVKTFYEKGYCNGFEEYEDILYPMGNGNLLGMDEVTMREAINLLSEGTVTLNDLDSQFNVLAVNSYDTYSSESNLTLGQTITVYLLDEQGLATKNKLSFKIIGIIDADNFPPYARSLGSLPTLIMPQSSFTENGFQSICTSISLDIDKKKHDAITASLDNLCIENGNMYYDSYMALTKERERLLINVIIFIMMALFIIALVGLLNLINTTFISIKQRKKEFGVLLALGLGRRGLSRILRWEGIYISLFCIIISDVIGVALGYGLYKLIINIGADYIKFSFPIFPMIILNLIYGFVPSIIIRRAVHKLLSSTTVNLLGQET